MKCPHMHSRQVGKGKSRYVYVKRIPCGKCFACKINKISEWAGRLYIENLMSKSAFFVALTYAENEIKRVNGFGTLVKRDVQKFFKKLRHIYKFKYFVVGEYGGEGLRPHYHILFFLKEEISDEKFIVDVGRVWNKGKVTSGTVTSASIYYCLKYITKEDRKVLDYLYSAGCDNEFRTMSRNPAIGDGISEEQLALIKTDGIISDGRRNYRISRYYRDKYDLQTESKDVLEAISKYSQKEAEDCVFNAQCRTRYV